MDNVYDKVDKTKDMDEQFNEFTHRAETLAKHINENISTLFNNIETFQKNLDVNVVQPPYSRDRLIKLAANDLVENLHLKHALVVLQGKDFIFKTIRYENSSTIDLQEFISRAAH